MAEFVVEFGKQADAAPDGALDAAAYHRNHRAIWQVLAPLLEGRSGDVLEAGSGTGQHVVAFARQSPGIIWWPSDFNERHLISIAAWHGLSQLDNIRAPMKIDLSDPDWCPEMASGDGPGPLLAVFCANVVHIAPWAVAQGLFIGAARYLRPDGRLVLYGPFKRGGHHTAVSNAVFDTSLRNANAEWGVRDIAEMQRLGAGVGLYLETDVDMPANNLMLVFARRSNRQQPV